MFLQAYINVLVLVNHRGKNAGTDFVTCNRVEDGSLTSWSGVLRAWPGRLGFFWTSDGENTYWVAFVVLERFKSDATRELYVVGSVIAAVGSTSSAVASSGGSHDLAERYVAYLGHKEKFVDHPIIDLQLLKRCVQKIALSVFACLDPCSLTEFMVTRFEETENFDWITSRSRVRRAIITNKPQMPSLFEVVANIAGVWLLIVSYLKKETGKMFAGDSLVVKHIHDFRSPSLHSCTHCFVLF